MAEWSDSAQQSANKDTRNSSPDDPTMQCKVKEWEPVVEVEESPDWEAKVEVESDTGTPGEADEGKTEGQ